MTQVDKDWLTYKEAAKLYEKSPETIRNWADRGLINKHRKPLDARIYVSRAEIDALQSARPTPIEREDG